jgi:hypothetical protein
LISRPFETSFEPMQALGERSASGCGSVVFRSERCSVSQLVRSRTVFFGNVREQNGSGKPVSRVGLRGMIYDGEFMADGEDGIFVVGRLCLFSVV